MKKILFSTLTAVFGLTAQSQWVSDATTGTPLVTTSPSTGKNNVATASDGAGGMYIAWTENRGVPTVYLQHVYANGSRQFATELVISDATGTESSDKSNIDLVPDGAGGVVVVWEDSRNRTTGVNNEDIYGQRVDAGGNILWTEDGIKLTDPAIASDKSQPAIDTVSSSQAMLVFGDNRNGNIDLYAQKINLADGSRAWETDKAIHGAVTGTQNQMVMASDWNGGVYVAYQDQRSGGTQADVYVQRIDGTGDPVAGWPADGVAIGNQSGIQFQPALLSLGSDGVIVTWADSRSGVAQAEIYAQRVSDAGVIQWMPATGMQIGDMGAASQSFPMIEASGTDHAIIVWGDPRTASTNRDIYAQRIANADGSYQWAQYGNPVVVNAGHQPGSSAQSGYTIASDGSGGVIVVWDDNRNGTTNRDIYAQRLNTNGETVWSSFPTGVPLITASGNQETPFIVPTVNNAFLVAWRDARVGTSGGEIYGTRLTQTGTLPVRTINLTAEQKAASVIVNWTTLGEENVASFVVEKSSNGRQFNAIGSVKARGEGNGSYSLEDNQPAKGANFYRIKAVDFNGHTSYSSVVLLQVGAVGKAAMAVYPNPVVATATLQLVNLPKGNYKLRVTDLSGRAVISRSIAVTNEYLVLPVSMQHLPAGNYAIQLEESNGFRLNQIIQKN